MKTLIHNKVKDNIPSNSSRNGYGCIEYTEDIKSGSSKITFKLSKSSLITLSILTIA